MREPTKDFWGGTRHGGGNVLVYPISPHYFSQSDVRGSQSFNQEQQANERQERDVGLTGRAHSQAHARGEGARILLVPAGFLNRAWSLEPACRDQSGHLKRTTSGRDIQRAQLKRRFLEPGAARRTHTQARRMKRRKSRSFRRGTPHSVVGACHAFSARLKVRDTCGRLSYTLSHAHKHSKAADFFCIPHSKT